MTTRALKTSLLTPLDAKGMPLNKKAIEYTKDFVLRRFQNWFPLGLGYASLMFMRYCLNPAKTALGDSLMDINDFGQIFGTGAFCYFLGFMINGPLVDRKGGRWDMLTGTAGAMVANLLIALAIYGKMVLGWNLSMYWTIMVLYAINMFFQSMGAMSIVKINMPWFHVKNRGSFSTIFGIMIALGVYFAYDWGQAICDATRGALPEELTYTARVFSWILPASTGMDQNWWMFLVPALFAMFWLVLMTLFLRTQPSDAGYEDFNTGEENVSEVVLTMPQMLRTIFLGGKHRVLITICLIEFCSGFTRNGVYNYYPQFAKKVGFYHDFLISAHWGVVLLICGVIGAWLTGYISDKVFNARRGPMAMILYVVMILSMITVILTLGSNVAHHGAWMTGLAVAAIAAGVTGVHGILSGTAAAEFSGKKNTAKAVGIVDGMVYLGTSLQAFLAGKFLIGDLSTASNWISWPMIILPAAILGAVLSWTIYNAFPNKGRSAH